MEPSWFFESLTRFDYNTSSKNVISSTVSASCTKLLLMVTQGKTLSLDPGNLPGNLPIAVVTVNGH